MKAILTFLLLTTLPAWAIEISYKEGFFTIPETFTEASSAEVKRMLPDLQQIRGFWNGHSLGESTIVVFSFIDPQTLYHDVQELRAEARKPQDKLKQDLSRGIAAANTSDSVMVDAIHVDELAQRITFAVSYVRPQVFTKQLVAIVPLNDGKGLVLIVMTSSAHVQEVLPTMSLIRDSLNSFTAYKLQESPSSENDLISGLIGAGIIVLGLAYLAGPPIIAYRRRMKNAGWILGLTMVSLFVGGIPGIWLWIWAIKGKRLEMTPRERPTKPSPSSAEPGTAT